MFDKLAATRILPVVVIDNADNAAPLADALRAGGQTVAEITLRTPAAPDALRRMASMPDMTVGAGTVVSVDQVKRAVDAGARFIVSPGFDPEIVSFCIGSKIPVMPGVSTASELQLAMKLGVTAVKFFPAEQCGGAATIKALSGPFPAAKFIPLGGVAADNMTQYLALSCVLAIGGSWMVKKELISTHAFDTITKLVAEAIALARNSHA